MNRFSRLERLEHALLVVAFLGLLITGLSQKYSTYEVSRRLVDFLGGIESVRILHRAYAILLIAVVLYHLLIVAHKLYVKGLPASLLPHRRDFNDAWHWALYNLGVRKERPRMPFFNFGEKWDYWNTAIGVLIMLITGLMMWNPVAVTQIFPGQSIPTARLIHGAEALFLLATIGIWHLYSVFIKQFNFSMLNGRLTHMQMVREHAAVLDEKPVTRDAADMQERQRRFIPAATIVLGLLIAGIALFLSFEDTAISTVPREEAHIFSPQISAEEGNADVGESLWPTLRCATCHGEDAMTSLQYEAPPLRNVDLPFDVFYQQVRVGGGEMPAFSAEEVPDNYLIHVWTWLTSADGD
ncbi:MAG: cytochrome b/b6 domain-containing protein [Chloroflexi bacterium]|nr:cytochrome b/b6 domain-containing protein [Chloroflexota bacterium]